MKSMNFVRNQLGVSAQTVRNYIKDGKIKAVKSPSGRFLFEDDEVNRFLGKNKNIEKPKTWAFYIRSSAGDKVLLENQERNLRENYPVPDFIFKDSGSGLNEKRQGLNRLLKKVKLGEITDVAITQKDRLTRFGNLYLSELFEAYNVRLHILFEDNKEIDLQEELMKDFMSLLASFSGKFYRLRSIENKLKLLEKAKSELNESNKSI